MKQLTLLLFESTFAIFKFAAGTTIPDWVFKSKNFCSITFTQEELSIVCAQSIIPEMVTNIEKDWKLLQVEGQIDFSLTGILSKLIAPLAQAKISIFAISTYNTDYILFKASDKKQVIDLLQEQYFIKSQETL